MHRNYETCLRWVLAHEGGYVNHPKDPGGATNRGVTQRVYDAWRRRNRVQTQSVATISDEEVRSIYRVQYWDQVRGDDLPDGVDYAVFDFAVNSGPSRAAKYLQRVAGVTQDGIIGNVTLAAVGRFNSDEVIRELCQDRMDFLRRLKTFGTFGKGWTRRVMGNALGVQDGDIGVIDRAIRLARAMPVSDPKRQVDGAAAKAVAAEHWLVRLIKSILGDWQ